MTVTDILMILAVVVSPLLAVKWSLHLQDRKLKRQDKMDLFVKLMAYRKSYSINNEWVYAMNLIEVIYNDDDKVKEAWKAYYSAFSSNGISEDARQSAHLNLLDEMAKSLGYKNLRQTDINSYYNPKGMTDQADLNSSILGELHRVLKETSSLKGILEPTHPPDE